MFVINRFLFILLLIYTARFTEEECIGDGALRTCSFDDFTNRPCPEKVILTSKTYRVLFKTDLAPCANSGYLNIRDCLTGIESGAFDNMDKLTHLIFDNNVLPNVSRSWFHSPLKVKLFQMTNCSIEDIEIDTFRTLEKLETLRLTYNKLTVIRYGIFNDLSIAILTLSKNMISELDDDCFANIRTLQKLQLDQNLLTHFVAKDVLKGSMDNLELLWLHKNSLRELSSVMLEGLYRLKVLNIGYNEISIIEPSTFEYTPDLKLLVLKNNHLTSFDSSIFPDKGLKNLEKLYIDNNRLTYLKSNVLHKLSKLRSIVIGGNPWQCKCLDIILKWLSDNDISNKCDQKYMDGSRPVCVVSVGIDDDECVYTDNSYFFTTYSEGIEPYPELTFCF